MANFRDFALKVRELEKGLVDLVPKQGTKEFILKSKLSMLVQQCNTTDRATDVTAAVRALMRFALDSLDFNSQFAIQVDGLVSYHDALVKAENKNAS